MGDRRQAELEVAEALACPLDMAKLFQVEGPASFEPLEQLWAEIVKRNAVDQEAMHLNISSSLSEESSDELRQMQINVRTWRDRARQEFLSQTRRFWDLRYVAREEYDKHLPPRGRRQPTSWIDDWSRHGPSLFHQDVPPDVMLTAFLHGIFFHFAARGRVRERSRGRERKLVPRPRPRAIRLRRGEGQGSISFVRVVGIGLSASAWTVVRTYMNGWAAIGGQLLLIL